MQFKFQELKIEQEGSVLKRFIKAPHTVKTIVTMVIFALVSLGFWYFSEGKNANVLVYQDILKSLFIGALFGLFITNSPCARGKC